ncbi:radical SAM protein, partial [Magnetococcales bacterium HHB-1]
MNRSAPTTASKDHFLMDSHKMLWHMDRIVQWQQEGICPPIYLEISPVSYCNNRCLFCGVDFQMEHGNQFPAQRFKTQLKKLAQTGLRSIMYAGEGEPLLHPEIESLITATHQAGIDASLTTNGNIGGKELWNNILPALTWVRFSMDAGDSKTYEIVHGVHGKIFHKTVDNIRHAVKLKKSHQLKTTIGVQFVIIPENRHNIKKALALFGEIGVDYISLKPYSLHPQMEQKKEVHYKEKEIEKIEQTVLQSKNRFPETKILFRAEAMRNYAQQGLNFSHCRALPFWGYIDAKGDFYTCSVFLNDPRFHAGNIHQH